MPKQITRRFHTGRSNKSGPAFPDEPTESEYVIQSMVEVEEKRLGRMLTPREIADITQHYCSSDEGENLPSFARNYSTRPSTFHPKKHWTQFSSGKLLQSLACIPPLRSSAHSGGWYLPSRQVALGSDLQHYASDRHFDRRFDFWACARTHDLENAAKSSEASFAFSPNNSPNTISANKKQPTMQDIAR